MAVGDLPLTAILAAPFALVIGSFMTVVAERVPAGVSIVTPRSRCPGCGTPILARDNVPVIGWILLRGRCRACGEAISPVYPLLEVSTATLIVGAFVAEDDVWRAIALAGLLSIMPVVTVIDVRRRIIPNRIVYPALAASAGYLVVARLAGAEVDLVRAGLGLVALGGGFLLVALVAPGGMGMGDVKLAALIGLVLGALGLGGVAVAAAGGILLGGIAALIALLAGASRRQALPFGPFLAAGAVIAAFWGTEVARAYLDLLR
jgi:leader peptidase (prepilin peptidase) / N-methyltransferase